MLRSLISFSAFYAVVSIPDPMIDDYQSSWCPKPSPKDVCMEIYAPVQCHVGKLQDCTYSNICKAISAGYTEDNCCPAPPDDIFCTMEYDVQFCGEKDCLYTNKCWAGAAGFVVDVDCTSPEEPKEPVSCPSPPIPNPIRCTEEYDPQSCGTQGCVYDNPCWAQASGFDLQECHPTGYPISCPFPPIDQPIRCTEEYNPHKCGTQGCVYDNTCWAQASGFDLQECHPTGYPILECPEPSKDTVCMEMYDPYICGGGSCGYDNTCWAEAAGYNVTTDCYPLECPSPSEDAVCPLVYLPHVCGSEGCVYDNTCLAEEAGYNAEMECYPMEDPGPTCPDVTPSFKDKKKCRKKFPETDRLQVTCGEDCLFGNMCLARKVGGFKNKECGVLEGCPEPIMTEGCSKEKKRVKCKSDDVADGTACKYMNKCYAMRAGFKKDECKRKIKKVKISV